MKKKQLKQQQILDEISDYDEEKEIKKIEEKLKPLAKPKANSGAAFAQGPAGTAFAVNEPTVKAEPKFSIKFY